MIPISNQVKLVSSKTQYLTIDIRTFLPNTAQKYSQRELPTPAADMYTEKWSVWNSVTWAVTRDIEFPAGIQQSWSMRSGSCSAAPPTGIYPEPFSVESHFQTSAGPSRGIASHRRWQQKCCSSGRQALAVRWSPLGEKCHKAKVIRVEKVNLAHFSGRRWRLVGWENLIPVSVLCIQADRGWCAKVAMEYDTTKTSVRKISITRCGSVSSVMPWFCFLPIFFFEFVEGWCGKWDCCDDKRGFWVGLRAKGIENFRFRLKGWKLLYKLQKGRRRMELRRIPNEFWLKWCMFKINWHKLKLSGDIMSEWEEQEKSRKIILSKDKTKVQMLNEPITST